MLAAWKKAITPFMARKLMSFVKQITKDFITSNAHAHAGDIHRHINTGAAPDANILEDPSNTN